MNERFEIGRKLLKSLGSDPGFFFMGIIAVVLKGVGTIPVVREELMMSDMRGSREGRQALTRTGEGVKVTGGRLGFMNEVIDFRGRRTREGRERQMSLRSYRRKYSRDGG